MDKSEKHKLFEDTQIFLDPDDQVRVSDHTSRTLKLNDLTQEVFNVEAIKSLTAKPPNKYKFIKSIGYGGMKTVLQVHDKDTSRDVAMAIIPDAKNRSDSDLTRFVQEARITAGLEHPNIVPVHDIGIDASGSPYFTMKLLKGENLAIVLQKLREHDENFIDSYDLLRLLRIFIKVCNAVAFAHSKGVIHLDLKPENIQIGDYGEVLLLDWGLAKVIGREDEPYAESAPQSNPATENRQVTMDGVTKGTPGYMAPEQAAGRNRDKDIRTDIYALGAMLYTMVTWAKPLEGQEIQQILTDTMQGNIIPPRLRNPDSDIPGAIEAVILKAMAVNPDERYQRVEEIREDIFAYMGGFATVAEKASVFKRFLLFLKRHLMASTFFGIILIMLVVFVGVDSYQNTRERWNQLQTHENEVKARMFWQQGHYEQAFRLFPEIFNSNPDTYIILRILQYQHQPLPSKVGRELLAWTAKTKYLKKLNITNFGLDSLEPLRGISLNYLDCSGNKVRDLSPLKGMELEFLDCSNNRITSLNPLEDNFLQALNCSNNPIESLEPLTDNPLRILELQGCNKVTDFTPLAEIDTLERLNLPAKVKNLDFIRELPNLIFLSCGSKEIPVNQEKDNE